MANAVEILSGLAPAVHCFLIWKGKKLQPLQAHPFVPTIHVAVKDSSALVLNSSAENAIGWQNSERSRTELKRVAKWTS